MIEYQDARIAAVGGYMGAGKSEVIRAAAGVMKQYDKKAAAVVLEEKTLSIDAAYYEGIGIEAAAVPEKQREDEVTLRALDFVRTGSDIVFIEPQGGRSDIAAQLLTPVAERLATLVPMCPYTVVACPEQVESNLNGDNGFSAAMNYLYTTQMEEADLILLSVSQDADAERMAFLAQTLQTRFERPVLEVCPQDGRGMEQWIEYIAARGFGGRGLPYFNREAYGRAAMETARVNTKLTVRSDKAMDINDFLARLIERIREKIPAGAAQVKACAFGAGGVAKAGVQQRTGRVRPALTQLSRATQANVLVGAFASLSPQRLAYTVETSLCELCDDFGAYGFEMGSEYYSLDILPVG